MTNYERIKSMSIDEMAKLMCAKRAVKCSWCNFRTDGNYCSKMIGEQKRWLKMKAEEKEI